MIPQEHRKKAAAIAIAATLVAGFEGFRQVAYSDPVGIPTICFGETKGVQLGQKKSREECMGMLKDSLEEADKAVQRCVRVPMPPKREAAQISLAYNIGGSRYCSGRIPTLLNAGKTIEACDAFLLYTKAKGIELPGLVRRRQEERTMCLEGLA